jgi:selenide,water dikinase
MGPEDLREMVAPLLATVGRDPRIVVGAETGDDAGVFRFESTSLVATVDFITPVCDDPFRFGRVAAANSISDVYAMGGTPLLALNVCCFPVNLPPEAAAGILDGAAGAMREAGAALVGGHTVQDKDLKFGLAVIGQADPERLLTNAGARAGDRLVLTKPIGTGLMINAFRADKLDADGLEPALVEMERLNATASSLAIEYGARGGTDVTGFGLAGHALSIARASNVGIRISVDRVPVHEAFADLVARGVSTGSTAANRSNVERQFENNSGLGDAELEMLFDPQTSGGLLLGVPPERVAALVETLRRSGHNAAEIGEVLPGPALIVV